LAENDFGARAMWFASCGPGSAATPGGPGGNTAFDKAKREAIALADRLNAVRRCQGTGWRERAYDGGPVACWARSPPKVR
jgi:hypothetical protein